MMSPLSRRQFLHDAASAMALTAALPTALTAADQDRSRKVTVGAHPWVYAATMENYDITPALDTIFADMKYAGMDAIELMHTALEPDDSVERIGELSAKYELPVLGSSFGAPMWDERQHHKILENAEKVISRLAKLGGRTLGTSVGDAGGKKTAQQLDDQADILRKIIALCNAHGVVLNLHNHKYEVRDDQYDLKNTLQRIPDVRLGPDLDWLVQADVDPIEFLLQHAERIVFLHLRDQKRDKTWVEAMGDGDMDYDAVGRTLKQIQFSGDAVIELAHPKGLKLTRPLREDLKISRQFVRDKLGY
jgi:sugar phosphate isomerase/epimerase